MWAFTLPINLNKYPGESSSLTTYSLCPVCLSAPRLVSKGHPPVSKRLRGDKPFWSKLRTAASRPSQTSTPGQVRAAHSRLLSLSRRFHHWLSRRNAANASSISVASGPMLTSNVDNGIPTRSVLLRSKVVLPITCRTDELRKLSKRLLSESIGVAQRLSSIPRSLSKRSEHCLIRVPVVGSFCNSFGKDRSTQLKLVHRSRRSLEAGLFRLSTARSLAY